MTVKNPFRIFAIFCCIVLALCCISCSLPSARQEALHIVATADSLDAAHCLYTDTSALRYTIRTLNTPAGKRKHHNALAAAYYYLGRNVSANNAIVEAANCYIACDCLHPDNPVLRGRVNSCMAHCCCRQDKALCFYQRSS